MRFQKITISKFVQIQPIARREKLNIHRKIQTIYLRYTLPRIITPNSHLCVILFPPPHDRRCDLSLYFFHNKLRILAADKFIILKSLIHISRPFIPWLRILCTNGSIASCKFPVDFTKSPTVRGIIAALRCILPAHFGQNSTSYTYVDGRFAAAFWSTGFAREHKITAEASTVKSAI